MRALAREARVRLPAFDTVTPMQRQVFTEGRAFGSAAERLMPYIRSTARALAEGNKDLAWDLEQEAVIRLWELDPSRFDRAGEPYLRRAMRVQMMLALRREARLSGVEFVALVAGRLEARRGVLAPEP